MKTMKMVLALCISAMGLVASAAMAAPDKDSPAEACSGIKVATGPKGKGYSLLFADLVKACGAEVQMCEVSTQGGLDNLNVLSVKDADIGFAAVDTWQTMKSGDDNIGALKAVAGLSSNYLHIAVAARGFVIPGAKKWDGIRKEDDTTVVIERFSQLRGRKVALVGSGQLLGRQLDRQTGMGMQFVDVDKDDQAFEMLRKGTVAAAFTVSGWPSGALKSLKQDSGITLVPFDVPTPGTVYQVKALNYKGLGVFNVNSLAIPNVLFTRPFNGERATSVAKLKACMTAKLNDLQEGDAQPAWNEVKSLDNTYDVPKFVGPAVTQKVAKK
ncbi:MAG: hypothetical protein E6R08_00625 [Nevskiaceae bacterium]|nr:MAG: hypothetical protein E6R08_00625 [Nevskiaceae bacterium]